MDAEERFIMIYSPADCLENQVVAAEIVTKSGVHNINEY